MLHLCSYGFMWLNVNVTHNLSVVFQPYYDTIIAKTQIELKQMRTPCMSVKIWR